MENFKAGQRRRRAELVGSVAMAVKESLELCPVAEKRIEDWLRGECGRHRQVTASEALGQRKEVGLNAFVMAGKKRR